MKLYIVTAVDYGGYDSWDVSYHLTKKGALKYIIDYTYNTWLLCRYIKPGSYDEPNLYISERELSG